MQDFSVNFRKVTGRIALIEDDGILGEKLLGLGLESYGLKTVPFADADDFLRSWTSNTFDLLVTDLHMEGESMLQVIRNVRTESSDIGIAMISAVPGDLHAIAALQSGCDIFLKKPITCALLASVLLALLRRVGSIKNVKQRVKPSIIDAGWYATDQDGRLVVLSEAERAILMRLQEQLGSPVPREALIDALKCDLDGFDQHRLDVLVHRLRRKLMTIARPRLQLFTIKGTGYGLVEL